MSPLDDTSDPLCWYIILERPPIEYSIWHQYWIQEHACITTSEWTRYVFLSFTWTLFKNFAIVPSGLSLFNTPAHFHQHTSLRGHLRKRRQVIINEVTNTTSTTPTHTFTSTPHYVPLPVFFAALQTSFPMTLSHRRSWSWVTVSLSQFWWAYYEGQLCGQGYPVWLQSLYFQDLINKVK